MRRLISLPRNRPRHRPSSSPIDSRTRTTTSTSQKLVIVLVIVLVLVLDLSAQSTKIGTQVDKYGRPVVQPGGQNSIPNGRLTGDLDANSHKILNLDASNLAISNATQSALDLKLSKSGSLSELANIPPSVLNAAGELRKTHNKINTIASGSSARINVLAVGDSVGHVKIDQLQSNFYEAYGDAGLGMAAAGINVSPTGDVGVHNNTGGNSDFAIWVSGAYYDLGTSSSASIKFANTHVATTLKIFYLAESGAGSFKFQSSPAGTNTWTDEATINASNASRIGAISTITKTAAAYDIRALGVSGRVKIIGVAFLNATGAAIWYIGDNGIDLASMVLTPSAIFNPILTDIAPDTIIFEMKDTAAIFNANLAAHQARFDAVAPLADWIYCGSNPIGLGQDNSSQVAQNAILRTFAQTNHKGYFDGYGVYGDFATMVAQGYSAGDGVHPNASGANFAAKIMARQFGFFQGDAVAIHHGTIARTNIDGSPIGQTTPAALRSTNLTIAGDGSIIFTDGAGVGRFDLTNLAGLGTYFDFDTALIVRAGYAGSGGEILRVTPTSVTSTKSFTGGVSNAAYAASITPNGYAENVNIATLTGNIAIQNPLNGTPNDGQKMVFRVIQDATGGRTVSWGTAYLFTDDITSAMVSTTASKVTYIVFRYESAPSAKWVAMGVNRR